MLSFRDGTMVLPGIFWKDIKQNQIYPTFTEENAVSVVLKQMNKNPNFWKYLINNYSEYNSFSLAHKYNNMLVSAAENEVAIKWDIQKIITHSKKDSKYYYDIKPLFEVITRICDKNLSCFNDKDSEYNYRNDIIEYMFNKYPDKLNSLNSQTQFGPIGAFFNKNDGR